MFHPRAQALPPPLCEGHLPEVNIVVCGVSPEWGARHKDIAGLVTLAKEAAAHQPAVVRVTICSRGVPKQLAALSRNYPDIVTIHLDASAALLVDTLRKPGCFVAPLTLPLPRDSASTGSTQRPTPVPEYHKRLTGSSRVGLGLGGGITSYDFTLHFL